MIKGFYALSTWSLVLLKVICWYWEEWGVYDEGKIKKINSTSCVYILVGMANALLFT